MIKISVDEAAAFDMLAILDCKSARSNNKELLHSARILSSEIEGQISSEKLIAIIGSLEYKHLLEINDQIFNLVDLAKQNKVTPKEVDDANYQRYLAKKKLQDVWFGTTISEQKIGYN